jgi:hypothetical protein
MKLARHCQLEWPRAEQPDAQRRQPLSPLPIPRGDHRPRRLVVLPLHAEPPRRRRPPCAPRHHRLLRIHPELVRNLRPRVRAAASASCRASRRHVASGRTLCDDSWPASVPLAGRRSRWRSHRYSTEIARQPRGSFASCSSGAAVYRTGSSPIASAAIVLRTGPSCRPSPTTRLATPTTGPKSHTSRRADASATCAASNPRHRPSGSSRSTALSATCSPWGDIGFGRTISDSCVRAPSLRGTQ